ncbi:hypothetical protein PF008_g992 [Phytophthora fragariae]|uniref:Uncharacterized protein n=1 Tax=Phytophthora fragariae TaxID=53985 RepID=A0A6G0SMH1_9STRA|nr:hypothetical protein PF008_g992 [Phytophthora fragariae]
MDSNSNNQLPRRSLSRSSSSRSSRTSSRSPERSSRTSSRSSRSSRSPSRFQLSQVQRGRASSSDSYVRQESGYRQRSVSDDTGRATAQATIDLSAPKFPPLAHLLTTKLEDVVTGERLRLFECASPKCETRVRGDFAPVLCHRCRGKNPVSGLIFAHRDEVELLNILRKYGQVIDCLIDLKQRARDHEMSKLNGMIEESKPAPGDYRDNQRIIELDSDDSMGDSEDFAGRLSDDYSGDEL